MRKRGGVRAGAGGPDGNRNRVKSLVWLESYDLSTAGSMRGGHYCWQNEVLKRV